MIATITNHLGMRLAGEIRCWMGRRIIEIETLDGARHIGRLVPDPTTTGTVESRLSTVDAVR
jgi:hypothetical protein